MRKKIDPKKATPKKKTPAPPAYRPFEKLAKHALLKPPPVEAPRRSREPVALPQEERDAQEEEAFEAHMRGVRPLDARAQRIPRTASSLAGAPGSARKETRSGGATDKDGPARDRLHAIVTDAIRFEVTDDGTHLEGRRVDVDPRELRRLRTMRYAVDGKLDLHGLTVTQARAAVASFLAKRASEGDRAVVVIHGKGKHSPRGDAVLRGELGAWLSQGSAARSVLAFASVVDQAGESGSLFILLTR